MESLGNKLKTARESKAYTIDYVSRETNISGRYLEALENEDFSSFPGEPYALGFLRTYGTYLELNPDELLSLYRSLKIEAQPTPVEELLKPPSALPKVLTALAAAVVVLALGGGAFWFFTRPPKNQEVESAPVRAPAEYSMSGESLERRFYPGDTILVPFEGSSYKLVLSGLSDTVSLTTPEGVKTLDLGHEALVDLNSNGIQDIRITLADFAKNDVLSGALLRFEMENQNAAAVSPVEQVPSAETVPAAVQGSAPVIFNSPSAYPFTLQAVFQGYCLFRWEVLAEADRQGRNEQYLQRSDERSIQAQNGIRIGVSNAQAVKLQVIGGGRTVPLELGGAGEVVAADIRWVRDEDNRFRLVLLRLE